MVIYEVKYGHGDEHPAAEAYHTEPQNKSTLAPRSEVSAPLALGRSSVERCVLHDAPDAGILVSEEHDSQVSRTGRCD